MSNKLIIFTWILFAAVATVSCEKEENKVYFEDSTAPVLTASSTAALRLLPANADNKAVRFTWTNPNYRFNTGVSSQDVFYTLQIDTAGGNFKSPGMQEIAIPRELSYTFTVKDLNTALTKMNLPEDVAKTLEIRLKASLVNGAVPMYSNVIRISVTPYLDVAVPVPANGNLWMTGDAAPSGWSNPLTGANETAQKFNKVSTTLYELTIALPGGGNYKLLQDNGNWGTQYHMLTGGTWEGGEFEMRDSDPGFPGPPTAGTYKITVNFKTGRYSVVKQ